MLGCAKQVGKTGYENRTHNRLGPAGTGACPDRSRGAERAGRRGLSADRPRRNMVSPRSGYGDRIAQRVAGSRPALCLGVALGRRHSDHTDRAGVAGLRPARHCTGLVLS